LISSYSITLDFKNRVITKKGLEGSDDSEEEVSSLVISIGPANPYSSCKIFFTL